jgi:uncharacterized protein (DUF302 family)
VTRRLFLAALFVLLATPASAEELIMVRVPQTYAEAMTSLQTIIKDHGYQLIRVQRVDVGLQARGFSTAEYRVVFLGKRAEIEAIIARHPELMPYLPLKIILFAEGETTLAVTNNPLVFGSFFRDPDLQTYFRHWETDVRSMLDQLAQAR